jgi:hypothetical protein
MYNENLAKEALVDGADYVQRLLTGIDGIVDNLLAGVENVALRDFVDMVDGLQWLVEIIELTGPTQNEVGVSIDIPSNFTNVINDMVEAFENSDYVLVGDLLNYEVRPIIEQWNRQFLLIKDRIEAV